MTTVLDSLRLDCVHALMCPSLTLSSTLDIQPYRLVTSSGPGELDLLSGPYHRLTVRANDREALEREGCSTVFRDGTQPRHLDQQSKSCGQL